VRVGDLFDEPDGATPLSPEDFAGLIPTWIATRADLNLAEQVNVAKAIGWASGTFGPGALPKLMTDTTMRRLHRHMFGEVWKWAGTYRRRETNLGIAWPQIPVQMRDLCSDVLAQTADPACLPWPADELAVRFHHRLVVIHPFPNGNGRHARLAADLLVEVLGRPPFTWGTADLADAGHARAAYLDALRLADSGKEFGPLVEFARS
jgi:Fic-DOC domain mobile mystery protein B